MIQLDVWSDIACPWCFLGKRRLDAALKASGIEAEISWHAFELSPDLPATGLPAADYYGKRFGLERLKQMDAKMTELGAADGIAFRFDKRVHAPNTRLAHRVIRLAREMGNAALQDAVVEACFQAHFIDGVNVSDIDQLLEAVKSTGIDTNALRTRLVAGDANAIVISDEASASQLGISGVPFFVVNGRLAMSGAQSFEVFVGFLKQARG